MTTPPLSFSQRCWMTLQVLVVRIVMRVLQAAFYELALSDSRAKAEMATLPEGAVFEIKCFGASPQLIMRVEQGVLVHQKNCAERPLCSISLKSLGLAFRMFTGQLGLAAANAQHGFTIAGDVAATMKISRLIYLAEAYLFPHLIARHVLIEVPHKEGSSILLYFKICAGFLVNKYTRSRL